MKKISILIIDNNVLARQAIARVLYRESSFVIVGIRGNAEDPHKHITNKSPDVVLLNVGSVHSDDDLAILKQLRKSFPDLPIVVLSPRTREGATAAITALRLGAVDFITKPESLNTILFAGRHFSKRLIPIIKAAADIRGSERETVMKTESVSNVPKASVKNASGKEKNRSGSINLITMGGCMGGPKALFSIIPNFPADFPVPVVVAQHFPKTYTSVLAEKLDEQSNITVREVYDGAMLAPGVVWIASGGYHCEAYRQGNRGFLKCHRGQRENNNRPSIDALFRSASQVYGEGVLGVILSGWGKDGLAGSEVIRRAGGKIIAQDPKTTLVPEMPTSVIRAGLSDEYCPIDELTEQIVKQADRSREAVSKRMIMQLTGSHFNTGSLRNQKDLFYTT